MKGDPMTTTIQEIATMLNGIEYPCRIAKEITDMAKSINAVIIYGASDDLVEFEGAFQDEIGCYDGCDFCIDQHGLLPLRDEISDDMALHNWFHRKETCKTVKVVWAPSGLDASWLFKTDVQHAKFRIMDNNDLYCLGLVISLDNLEDA